MNFKKFLNSGDKMKKAVKKMKAKKPSYVDDRFWKTSPDKQGNADAVLRFLPQQEPEKAPIVMKHTHFFKENGKWFVCDCPTTFEMPCPADEYAQPYWDEDTKESKEIALKYSRKKRFISNVLVVNDINRPENNGKVFLYEFGIKIYEKIIDKLDPESELDEPIMIHDFLEGRNFKLKQQKVGGFINYDKSEFYSDSTPVAKTEKKMEEVYNQITDLDQFVDPEKIKSYSELKKKFIGVVGQSAAEFFSGSKDKPDNDMGLEHNAKEDEDDLDDSKFSMNDGDTPKEKNEPEASEVPWKEDSEEADEKKGGDKKEKDDEEDFDFDDEDFDFDDEDFNLD